MGEVNETRKTPSPPWRPEDDARMLDLYAIGGAKYAAEVMGKSPSAIATRHHRMRTDLKVPYAVRRRAVSQAKTSRYK